MHLPASHPAADNLTCIIDVPSFQEIPPAVLRYELVEIRDHPGAVIIEERPAHRLGVGHGVPGTSDCLSRVVDRKGVAVQIARQGADVRGLSRSLIIEKCPASHP